MKSFHARVPRHAGAAAEAAPARRPVRSPAAMQRADALVVQQGLAPSRTVAQRLIASGRVSWEGKPVSKPAQELPPDAALKVVADNNDRYVSRGGIKLAGALARTGLDVRGKACLDVGQSTGGFTDCLLQAGAARVIGIDVGHGQLHPRLRDDPRVTCFEGINARALGAVQLPAARFDVIVGDVSFISLTLVLPQLPPLLAADGNMLLLVKPQFEVGPEHIGKGGIVRDTSLYPQVEARLRQAAEATGLSIIDYFDSPIAGTDGNHEFFIWMRHAQH